MVRPDGCRPTMAGGPCRRVPAREEAEGRSRLRRRHPSWSQARRSRLEGRRSRHPRQSCRMRSTPPATTSPSPPPVHRSNLGPPVAGPAFAGEHPAPPRAPGRRACEDRAEGACKSVCCGTSLRRRAGAVERCGCPRCALAPRPPGLQSSRRGRCTGLAGDGQGSGRGVGTGMRQMTASSASNCKNADIAGSVAFLRCLWR